MTTDEMQAQLLKAVQGLKTQVTNRESLSATIDWNKKVTVAQPVKIGSQTKDELLNAVCQEMGDCQCCPLGKTRKNLVFGQGNPEARIVFVGEAPGADEDEQGLPFVGRAGQLLTDIIVKGMKIQRKDVYICNILKCRPPGNRNPQPEEIGQCEPFLKKQLRIISPEIICALGTFAAKTLLKTDIPISVLRGRFHSYEGIKLMPTYHPAYLLRNPSAKKQVWEDVQMIMKEVNL
ncbi:MAG: uracil-DNA glycosylase [Smithella sp.]|nr:uracil-DNA glycosylase [Smithella sp.]